MIIDGNAIARKITDDLKQKIATLPRAPRLTVILVGHDPASSVYVSMKEVRCKEAGILSEKIALPETTSENELVDLVRKLNDDDRVNGILVQLPLPKHISDSRIIREISPGKDVDGFHPVNIGLNQLGKALLVPCTPKGVIRLLDAAEIPIEGKHAVIIGRSNIVGKPLMQLFLQRNATVTVCHSKTADLAAITSIADILVAAVGRPNLVTADMVKKGAIVIDIGVNRVEDTTKKGYHLCGDVDYEHVKDKAGAITPVPGGVGPMTIAMLMENTVLATEAQQ